MEYRYSMGFSVNGTPIPDPSSFKGAQSDLDTLGERDSNGDLRRNKVAMKCNMEIEWQNIGWSMMTIIGNLLNKSDRFMFTYPDPIEGLQTIIAYCGDRNWEAVKCTANSNNEWVGTFKVKIIEI